MRFPSRRSACLGVFALAGAGGLAATAAAANPHVVSAAATMNSPTIVSPGNITWNNSLNVPFKIAGLGKNTGLTATLTAFITLNVVQEAATGANSVTIDEGFTSPGALVAVIQSINPGPGTNFASIHLHGTTATLTSDKNGQVTGTLTIPGEIDASTPGSECVQASWTQITLTIGSITVNLPDVSKQYDSTGSFCS